MRLSRRGLALGGAALLFLPRFARAQPAHLSPADWRADFDELFARLRRAHFDLFANRSPRAYAEEHARLRAMIDKLADADAAVQLFQRFVAYGRIAHARIDGAGDAYRAYRRADGAIFPLTVRVKAGRVYVTSNASGGKEPRAGAELLSIEGRPIAALLADMRSVLSADTTYMFHSMLEWELPRLLWQTCGALPRFKVTVRHGRRGASTVFVPARTQQEIDAAPLDPPLIDASPTRRTYRMLEDGIGYIRPGAFYAFDQPDAPYDNRAFTAFIDEAFRHIMAARSRTLIVDLRDNPGGDNSFSDALVSWFASRPFRFASQFKVRVSPEAIESNRMRLEILGNDPTGVSADLARLYASARVGDIIDFPIATAQPRSTSHFDGRVFVLINRHSYSNAVNVAALVQDYRFATVLGEETSDLATTIGAMEHFTLTRSRIKVGFPKACIVRAGGGLARRGVVPDISIEVPLVDQAEDNVLLRAVSIARAATA